MLMTDPGHRKRVLALFAHVFSCVNILWQCKLTLLPNLYEHIVLFFGRRYIDDPSEEFMSPILANIVFLGQAFFPGSRDSDTLQVR